MQGFPPPPDKTVRFSDGSSGNFPATRWAFSHFRELVPTADRLARRRTSRGNYRAPSATSTNSRHHVDGKAITLATCWR